MRPKIKHPKYDWYKSEIEKLLVKQPFAVQSPSYINLSSVSSNKGYCKLDAENTDKYVILIDCSQLDIPNRSPKKPPIASCLREQYPNATGITRRKYYVKDNVPHEKLYIEISFSNALEWENALLKQFVLDGDRSIHVNKPLQSNARVFEIEIHQIPLQNTDDDICKRLTEIFNVYGDIMELGLYKSMKGGWFTGRGYARISVDKFMENNKRLALQLRKRRAAKYKGNSYIHFDCSLLV